MNRMFFLFLILLLSSARIWACGTLSLDFESMSLGWSPTSQQFTRHFEVRREAPFTPCNYFITFSKGSGASFETRMATTGSQTLPYQIYGSPSPNGASILKDLGATQLASHFISGSFDASASTVRKHEVYIDFPFNINQDPFLPHYGNYLDSITAQVYQGLPKGPELNPQGIAIIPITIAIGRFARMSLGPPSGQFLAGRTSEKIDFGVLEKGASRNTQLRVMTNAGYKVSVSSMNNGVMVHDSSNIHTTVPYQLRLNSKLINLQGSKGQPVLAAEGRGTSRLSGIQNDLQVTIGEVDNKMGGTYRDVLTFEVKAIE